MKLTIASLVLAASSVFAVPHPKPREYIELHNLTAMTYDRNPTAGMTFAINDTHYASPLHCRINWNYGEVPEDRPYCGRSEYHFRFPNGAVDFNKFTLEAIRDLKGFPGHGWTVIDTNTTTDPRTKWHCKKHLAPDQPLSCAYNGVVRVKVRDEEET